MFSGLRAVACLGAAFTASADSALELNGENAYISIDGLIPHLPSAQFTVSMWVFPTPGLKSGLGTTFAMNTATGGNVMSLAVDRDTSEYVYKVRCYPLQFPLASPAGALAHSQLGELCARDANRSRTASYLAPRG
jgi:hypothetical protein